MHNWVYFRMPAVNDKENCFMNKIQIIQRNKYKCFWLFRDAKIADS